MGPVKRKFYSNELKSEIIQMAKSGVNRAVLAKKYNVSRQLIARWVWLSNKVAAEVKVDKGKVGKAKPKKVPKNIDSFWGPLPHDPFRAIKA